MSNRPLLVVEDEPDGRELVSRLLLQMNVKVYATENAEQALQALQESVEYGAVIIDLALPGMDGLQLLEAIRGDARTRDLPCFAITAYHTPELKQKALQSGFNGYFAKPLDSKQMLAELGKLLN
jgi:CheY-like chemotaxis protein